MCTVVNKYKETYDIDITRNGKWGNPFTLREFKNNRELCLEYYECYLEMQLVMGKLTLDELRGKRLGCTCKPMMCHGDILKEFIDGTRTYEPTDEIFIAISGSRTITNPFVVNEILSTCIPENAVLILGGARGVDTLARNWAIANGIDYIEFSADWEGLGKSAGYTRNKLMHVCSHSTLAIWDGESRGTKHMIDMASEAHPVTVHKIV